MKVIAHRGYSGLYPENTMLAFQKAVDAGCDEIELDVQATKDGVLVIMHDEDVGRTTNGKGYIKDISYQELRELNAGILYEDQYGFWPVPSLEEYLGWVKEQKITTNIELKNRKYYYKKLEDKVIDMVKSYNLIDRVMFSSFNHVSLLRCKQLAPEIECGIIVGKSVIMNAGDFAKTNQLECYHPDINYLTKKTVVNCKKQGVKINAWTINDIEVMQKLYDWGCDGAITNYPDTCRAWLNSKIN